MAVYDIGDKKSSSKKNDFIINSLAEMCEDMLDQLEELKIQNGYVDESVILEAAGGRSRKTIKIIKKVTKSFLLNNGISNIMLTTFMISSENKKFRNGTGNMVVIGIDTNSGLQQAASYGGSTIHENRQNQRDIANACKCIKENKKELIHDIYSATGLKVKSIVIEDKVIGGTRIIFTFE